MKSFAIQFHITDECDQRCEHCYIFAEGEPACLESMPLKEMIAVIEQVEDMATLMQFEPYVYLTGGDPLLHPSFWELAEVLYQKRMLWAVMGNPFHVNEKVAKRLKQLGCRKYQISLDGMEKTHDAFRKPGSFARSVEALRVLQNAGIWTAVMTTVSSVNMHEIPQLIDYVAELGVDVCAFARYCPTSGQRKAEFHIDARDYRLFLLECQKHIDAHEAAGCKTTFQRKDHLWTLLEYEQGRFEIPTSAEDGYIYDGCHCACSHITITPKGEVYGCRRMDSLVGNLGFAEIIADEAKVAGTVADTVADDDASTAADEAEDSAVVNNAAPSQPELMSIFLGDKMEALRDFDKFEKCARCELLAWCRGCPAVAYGYTGNMYAADPQCWKEVS